MLARQEYREAHGLCMKALQADPAEPRAFYLLGILTADHSNHSKAIELFDRALAVGTPRSDILAQKARCQIALLQREEAVQSAEAAARLEPAASGARATRPSPETSPCSRSEDSQRSFSYPDGE